MIFSDIMSKKLIISLFIVSVFVPYVAQVSHIFMHSHEHKSYNHNHFHNDFNEMEEDCVLCFLLSNPLNHLLTSFALILLVTVFYSKILFEEGKFRFSDPSFIYLRAPPNL